MTAVAAPPVHALLLALAGRVDDDLLAWARELLAVGEEGQAIELATTALVAERVVLPPSLRAALVAAAHGAHADLDVDATLPPPADQDGTPHRFDAAAAPGDAVAAALGALPARRLAGCTLHLTWRRTPAGTAPGPLPRAVVLVEADPDRSADVLAYLLATELDRAGAPASVEVFTAGAPLPAYHQAALHAARPVTPGVPGTPGPVAGRHETSDATGLFLVPPPGTVAPETATTAAETRTTAPETVATQTARDREPADAAPEPDEAAPELPTRPSGRRRRPEPEPAADDAPAPVDEPDPLGDPLHVPLLEPLLDPRGLEAAEPAPHVPEPTRPEPSRLEPSRRSAEPETPEPAVPAPTPPGDVPAEWEEDWRTGEWAMPRTPPQAEPPDDAFDVFGPADHEVAEPDLPRRSERTGRVPATGQRAPDGASLFDSPTARGERAPGPDAPQRRADGPPDRRRPTGPPTGGDPLFGPGPSDVPLFGDDPGPAGRGPDELRPGRRRRPDESPEPGLPPDSADPSVLLSGTERDLLAQLQDELAARERRPRPYRRAGHNGSARSVNGHGPDGDQPPPDPVS